MNEMNNPMIKKGFLLFTTGLLILVGVLVFNTLRHVPQGQVTVSKQEFRVFDTQRLAQNLAASVRFKTISHQDSTRFDRVEFVRFLEWLEEIFPNVHRVMERKLVGDFTPVYVWKGKDESLKPVLLTGHYDVVPVLPGTRDAWKHPAFAGIIADGFIWGRGTLDDKVAVIGLLEAAERLIRDGVQPMRSVYFVFGHDEEVGGQNGAGQVVRKFQEEGISFLWSLDEGSMILDGLVPGIERPIASINVAEKGYLTLDIIARSEGGHSALPPPDTAISILAAAIRRLQTAPVPGGLSGVSADFLDTVARDFPFFKRLLFANRWLFKPVLEVELSKAVTTNALLKTTMAPTMLSASVKENVLPVRAVATVNFRLHPRDSVDSVTNHVRTVIADERIKIVARANSFPASPVSDHSGAAFAYLSSVFLQVFGDIIIAPGLTVAATDARHYARVSQDTFRILPVMFGPEDIARIHGTNERIAINDYVRAVIFYSELIEQL